VLACAAAASILVTLAPSAMAAPARYDFTASGVNIHTGPHVGDTVVGQGNPGDGLVYHNSKGGGAGADWVGCPDGSGSTVWDEVTDIRTGVRGWVSECFLSPVNS